MKKIQASTESRLASCCAWLFNDDAEFRIGTPSNLHPRMRAGLDGLVELDLASVKTDPTTGAMTWTGKPGITKLAKSVTRKELKENSFPVTLK